MKLETRAVPFEIRTAGDGDGSTFDGVGAAFYTIDTYCTIFAPGCFSQDIAITRSEGVVRNEHCCTIGKITAAEERAGVGLAISGLILDTTDGLDVRKLVKAQAVKGLSVGFITKARLYLESRSDVEAWWTQQGYTPTDQDLERAEYGATVLTRVVVREVSTVFYPSNPGGKITAVRSGERARRSLGDECLAVLDSVEALSERMAKVKALRNAQGREIGPEFLARVKRIEARLAELKAPATAAPAPAEAPLSVEAVLSRFALIEAEIDGNL